MRSATLLLLIGCGLCSTTHLSAAELPSPLRAIPETADIVVQTANARHLAEAFTTIEQWKQLRSIESIKELTQSTQARRLSQMVGYFERELGAKWPELLDQIAGGGVALATEIGKQPGPALLIVQGKDEKTVQAFAQLALKVLEQEVARQESGARVDHDTYGKIATHHLGKEFHAAAVHSTLLISNQVSVLHAAIDRVEGKTKKSALDNPSLTQAHKVLPPKSLATLWVNMEKVRQQPGANEFYKTPRDPAVTVLFGAYVDVLGRTPFVAAGLYREGNQVKLSVRLPAGREGMWVDKVLNGPSGNEPGSRPLLEPKGALFSYSFYLDLSRFWLDRHKLFGKDEVKGLEEFDNNSGKILSNLQFSKVLNEAGAYHRFVAVAQQTSGYKRQTKQPLPAFAFVTEVRDPVRFREAVEPPLRGLGLVGSLQFGMSLIEEKYKDHEIIGYRFSEKREVKEDVNDIRFNFSPCLVVVGKQFAFCSTFELARELADLLEQEAHSKKRGARATSRMKFFSSGVADYLHKTEDQLITQTILGQAVPIEQARKETRAFLDLLRSSGGLQTQTEFLPNETRYDITLSLGK